MEKIIAWMKANPYKAVGIGFVGFLAIYMLRENSASNQVGSDGVSSQDVALAQVQAGASLQGAAIQAQQNIAQIQANAQTNAIQAALEQTQIEANTIQNVTTNNNTTGLTLASMELNAATQVKEDELALANKGVDLSKMGNRAGAGVAVVEAALGVPYSGSTATAGGGPSSTTAQNISAVGSAVGNVLSSIF